MFNAEFGNKLSNAIKSDNLAKKIEEDFIGLILNIIEECSSSYKITKEISNFVFQIPNQIYFNKMKKLLQGSYCKIDTKQRVKFAEKFSDDGYDKYVRRQLELIDSMNDENKIQYIANLTRACVLGFIDVNVYFKLSYIINQATVEELIYLGENINNAIKNNNAYIFAFQQIGLVKEGLIAGASQNTSKYFYTEFAIAIDRFAIKFDEENTTYKYDSSNLLTLESMKFKDTDIDIDTMSEEEVEQFKRELLAKADKSSDKEQLNS
ncbi:hypothetical protein ACUH7Y_09690 [Clostridium beijerinckii]|uniref:Uncharacterized protein n=1 Tax=Clostridium beijerinckii TaxID=1520 RepID=A0A7X9SMH0_CLOBE|nr:hypothetical protein [Clostridium beijerinckii]NMF04583.1 hypothetical protein [Clostridium beijerinckii]